jgi:hypothetical protein
MAGAKGMLGSASKSDVSFARCMGRGALDASNDVKSVSRPTWINLDKASCTDSSGVYGGGTHHLTCRPGPCALHQEPKTSSASAAQCCALRRETCNDSRKPHSLLGMSERSVRLPADSTGSSALTLNAGKRRHQIRHEGDATRLSSGPSDRSSARKDRRIHTIVAPPTASRQPIRRSGRPDGWGSGGPCGDGSIGGGALPAGATDAGRDLDEVGD